MFDSWFFLTTSFAAIENINSKWRVIKGFEVDFGKDRCGQSVSLFYDETFYTKVSTNDSDGDEYVSNHQG